MNAEAKLAELLAGPEHTQTPLIELLIDVICMLDAEWDISKAPSLEAIRALLAALVIDCGVASDEDGEELGQDFDRRFVDAFDTFQLRMQQAARRE